MIPTRYRPYLLVLAGVVGTLVFELVLLSSTSPGIHGVLGDCRCESAEAILKKFGLTNKGTPLSDNFRQSGAMMTVVNDAKVYAWTEQGWRLQEAFCGGPNRFEKIMVRTSAKDVTFYTSQDSPPVSHGLLTDSHPGAVLDYVLTQLHKTPGAALVDIDDETGIVALAAAAMDHHVVAVTSNREHAVRMCKAIEDGGFSDKVTLLFAEIGHKHGASATKFPEERLVDSSGRQTRESNLESDSPEVGTVLMDDVISFVKAKAVVVSILGRKGQLDEILGAASRFFETFTVPLVLTRGEDKAESSREATARDFLSKRHYVPHLPPLSVESNARNLTGLVPTSEFLVWKLSEKYVIAA